MTEDQINTHCLSLPGTHLVIQWKGSRVYKVGEKLFAILGGEGSRVTLKCADPETAAFLIEIGAAAPAPHLKRGGWISLSVADVGDEEMAERLTTSYTTVRESLPKRVREALG
ncbi:MAG: MmcQ/YjbR family DNA-binding protein [Pseudomonadota bacterium]